MPILSNPSFAQQNTTATNDMSADGYNFAAVKPILVDQYGKFILWAQRQNGGAQRSVIVVSNDSGATWSEPTRTGFFDAGGEAFVVREQHSYDSVNDLIHTCWIGNDPVDGVIYRRYSFTRDVSHNITGVTRVAGINLQLDFQSTGTMNYQHPCALWIPEGGANGSVFCLWGARNSASAGNKSEIRCSMRVLSNSVADNTAGNWVAPVSADTTTIGNPPTVAYSSVYAANVGGIAYPGVVRKAAGTNAKDIYVGYSNGDSSGGMLWRFRRLRWNSGANNWSTGMSAAVTLSALKIAGTDTGYSLKDQLMSQISEDTVNDRMYVGFPIWLSDVAGDTVSFVFIDNADGVSSRVDVYSANGAHSYAPCLDLVFNNQIQRLAVSYIKTTTQFTFFKTYAGTVLQGSEITAFTAAPVDIPLLYSNASFQIDDDAKLPILFRDTINTPTPPYHGWFGTMDWEILQGNNSMTGMSGMTGGGDIDIA